MTSDRRAFIETLGIAVLTVQCLPLMVHAAEASPASGTGAGDDLVIRSGPGLLDHMHDLLVPYAVLNAPPREGVKLTSTKALLHQHTFQLTQSDLTTVKNGGTVTQKASSHVFVIALSNRYRAAQTV